MAEQEYEIRNKHMLVVAALLGLLAVILFLWHDYRIRRANEEDMISVLSAAKDLIVGDLLTDDSMERTRIPQRLVPSEQLDEVARASDYNAILNMGVIQDVSAGRILRWSYLSGGQSRSGNSSVPRQGYRVVPLKVDRDTCPPSLATGMYVDLMTTLPNGATVAVMEKVQVKTINGVGAPGASSRTIESVGLEIRAAEAVKLIRFLSIKPRITLLVRNPQEKPTIKGVNPAIDGLTVSTEAALLDRRP